MNFIVRTLTEQEMQMANFGAHGIPNERIPTRPLCAIDESGGILFTQLRGPGYEMRDGDCPFVLFWKGRMTVLQWDYQHKKLCLSRLFFNPKHSHVEEINALEIGNKAINAIHNYYKQPSIIIST